MPKKSAIRYEINHGDQSGFYVELVGMKVMALLAFTIRLARVEMPRWH